MPQSSGSNRCQGPLDLKAAGPPPVLRTDVPKTELRLALEAYKEWLRINDSLNPHPPMPLAMESRSSATGNSHIHGGKNMIFGHGNNFSTASLDQLAQSK